MHLKTSSVRLLKHFLVKRRGLSSSSSSSTSSNVFELRKEKLKSGPSLKDFVISNSNDTDKTISSPNDDYTTADQLLRYPNEGEDDQEASDAFEGRRRKVFFEVFGCQMNTNDTEIAYSILDKTNAYERTWSEREADVVLLVTCSIRENAEQKIWNRLKELRFLKRRRHDMQVGILGCMAERLKDKIVTQEKIVDVVCGPDSYRSLPELLNRSLASGNAAMNVQLSFEETYAEISPLRINANSKSAYVSIQRGCDNMCSFCIVPFVRGRERSRPIASIIDEVRQLADAGIKEVTLLGQNVNSYRDTSELTVGVDKQQQQQQQQQPASLSKGFTTIYKPKLGGRRFVDLLDAVSRVDSDMRVRFTSPHPKDFPDELLQLMSERPNIAKCIHLPAQSGSSSCLERMRRGYTRDSYLELVAKIRSIQPHVAFTSDFIAGFCGETEQEHADTLSLMRAVDYTFCFMYAYSMREKTRAYHRLVDDVPHEVKQRRYLEMVDVFRTTASRLNASKHGQVHLVLVDMVSKRSADELSGRNDNNTIVVFPKVPMPRVTGVHELEEAGRQPLSVPAIGDYVACRLESSTSQSFRATPLFVCNLQTFARLDEIYSFKTAQSHEFFKLNANLS